MTESPLVTIRCITYNHEPYIRQTLEGFVMQQTNFPFEAVVHDDASTDGTADVIREYAEKYPDIIKPIYETENQYSKRDGSLQRIMLAATRGKYAAPCEGDDYWTDPHKLQKQVDFMESHPEYSMCFHSYMELREEDGRCNLFYAAEDRCYSGVELCEHSSWSQTATRLLRSEVYFSPLYEKAQALAPGTPGDVKLLLSAAAMGKIYGMSDVMSVYRHHTGGATAHFGENPSFSFAVARLLRIVPKVFGKEYASFAREKAVRFCSRWFREGVKNGDWRTAWKALRLCAGYNPFYVARHFLRKSDLRAVIKRMTRFAR